MSESKINETLGVTLTSLLKSRSFSMRKLSSLTGIDTATISRIISGKQKARLHHLETFALHLGVPTAQLFQAAGFDISVPQDERQSDIYTSISSVQKILQSSNFIDHQFTAELVQKELSKYEQYALTEEGKQIIIDDFPTKFASVNGAGPFIDRLKQMYLQFCENDITSERRALLGSALLYFVMSADIIPDYVFPLGYLDDAIAVQLVLDRLKQSEDMA
ncbi:DUF1232 domain-containing protein [Paenibacillus sp. N3.4]|uniref:DUF1232 domain-containing protein n=1 Tax=Paenibacillus sp. N3.4 TaxID=2603222 RepID=UPI0011CB15DA|nr:DUF1232 domain-containing protein [Paenibacillus sp. N3.4]TXK77362.1 DUF1232 domain-containing protein [Paenibacillus sp. N3.4]